MPRRTIGRPAPALPVAAAVLLAGVAAAGADWATREGAQGIEAGTRVEGAFAGLLLTCAGAAGAELRLTHNGARFDPGRKYTLVLSVDGVATLLSATPEPRGRPGDDDLVHAAPLESLDPLLSALSGGRDVEISAPSARYTLPLAGSSRAIASFRAGCPAR